MAGEDDVRDGAGARHDTGGRHGAGAVDAGAHEDVGVPPEDAPQGPSGPAPVIDLGDSAVPVRPAKPLGPRRLARLQRELEERSRELAETGGGTADPEMLAKQLRFAELTAQAEAANAGTTGEVQAAAPESARPGPWVPRHATSGPAAPESAPVEPGAAEPPEPAPAYPPEQITVIFPGSGDPDADGRPDPVHVDPALFSNRLAPEDLAALTHIEIVPAGATEPPSGQAVQPAGAPAPSVGDAAPPVGRTVRSAGDGAPQASAPSTEDDVAPAPRAAAPPATAPSAPGSSAADVLSSAALFAPGDPTAPPPAEPVPAARAEGLELLDPKEYRRRSGPAWAALVLSLVAALVVVVLLFVL